MFFFIALFSADLTMNTTTPMKMINVKIILTMLIIGSGHKLQP